MHKKTLHYWVGFGLQIDLFTLEGFAYVSFSCLKFAKILSHIDFILSLSEYWNQIIVTVVQTKPALVNSIELWICNLFPRRMSIPDDTYIQKCFPQNGKQWMFCHFVSCPRNPDKHITHLIDQLFSIAASSWMAPLLFCYKALHRVGKLYWPSSVGLLASSIPVGLNVDPIQWPHLQCCQVCIFP